MVIVNCLHNNGGHELSRNVVSFQKRQEYHCGRITERGKVYGCENICNFMW